MACRYLDFPSLNRPTILRFLMILLERVRRVQRLIRRMDRSLEREILVGLGHLVRCINIPIRWRFSLNDGHWSWMMDSVDSDNSKRKSRS